MQICNIIYHVCAKYNSFDKKYSSHNDNTMYNSQLNKKTHQYALRVLDVVAVLDVHVSQELFALDTCSLFVGGGQLRQTPDGEGALSAAQICCRPIASTMLGV